MNRPISLFGRLSITIFLFFIFTAAGWADYINGDIEVTYKPGVIDFRPNENFTRSGEEQTTETNSFSDLKIGSVFIDVNGDAFKVTDIYESAGRTVIETTEPDFDEVFKTLEIPDFELTIDREDITELGEGVTLLSEEESRDLSNYYSSEFSTGSRLLVPDDTRATTLNINRVLYSSSSNSSLVKRRQDQVPPQSTYSVSKNIEVRVRGTIQASLSVSGNYKWGSAKAQVNLSQTLNVTVTGTANLTKEYKFLIYGFGTAGKPNFSGGLYAKVTVHGEVSLAVELYESTSHTFGASTKNVSYVPYKISPISSHTYNIGFKPSITADGYIKAGPTLEGKVKWGNITLASATLNSGLRLNIVGFLGATTMIGRTNSGPYGGTGAWIAEARAYLTAFLDANIKVLGKSKDLFDESWFLKSWYSPKYPLDFGWLR